MTYQAREYLVYSNKRRLIRAEPMTGCDRPVPCFPGFSTAYARGYQGTWQLESDTLTLIVIAAPHEERGPNALDRMFAGHRGPVEAYWYSGEIASDDRGSPDVLPFVLVIYRGKLLVEQELTCEGKVSKSRVSEYARPWASPNEWAFFAAIHASYHDSAPRLIYADWLEERGDARAALLRGAVNERRGRDFALDYPQEEWLLSGFVDPDDKQWYWRRLVLQR